MYFVENTVVHHDIESCCYGGGTTWVTWGTELLLVYGTEFRVVTLVAREFSVVFIATEIRMSGEKCKPEST